MKYVKPFSCFQSELLVLDGNTWSHLTVYKQMNTG